MIDDYIKLSENELFNTISMTRFDPPWKKLRDMAEISSQSILNSLTGSPLQIDPFRASDELRASVERWLKPYDALENSLERLASKALGNSLSCYLDASGAIPGSLESLASKALGDSLCSMYDSPFKAEYESMARAIGTLGGSIQLSLDSLGKQPDRSANYVVPRDEAPVFPIFNTTRNDEIVRLREEVAELHDRLDEAEERAAERQSQLMRLLRRRRSDDRSSEEGSSDDFS